MPLKLKKLTPIVEWGTLLLCTALVCFFLVVILCDIFSVFRLFLGILSVSFQRTV